MFVDEIKKNFKKKEKKNKASLGEPCKLRLIFQTRNPLNYRPKLN
jgi:hypothetical protein